MNELSRIEEISFFRIDFSNFNMHVNCSEPVFSGSQMGLRFSISDRVPSGHTCCYCEDPGPQDSGRDPTCPANPENFTLGVDTYHRGQKSLIVLKSGGFTKDLYRETSSYHTSLCHAL